jgi:SSS family solute:Na+ symporter
MRPLDWWVLGVSLVFIVAYGLWRSRGSRTTQQYLLAGKSMPWYAMALSIMATQASAITFISTTGQAYVDGMRFVQMYFGMPIALVLISAIAVPIFHRANVYTAYEYLETRFDAKTRAVVSLVFLISRGLAVGVALSAPALVMTVIFGWPERWTILTMGALTVAYTAAGGVKAVTWTDFQQMLVMLLGLFLALGLAIYMLPSDISLGGAVTIAGAAGRLNAVVTSFNWNDRYNLWNGLLGGMFLMLAYFGCDQSQVQRYLTGKSIAQSRLSLLFNAMAKIPMQFFILFTGTIVFVFYTFQEPPVLFHQQALESIRMHEQFPALQSRFGAAFTERRNAARALVHGSGSAEQYAAAQSRLDEVRSDASQLVRRTSGAGFNDANYIFLTFVTTYLPAGVVGLIMAAIFAAAMSTISAELNSLATVSVIDIYKRHLARNAADFHYVTASRIATVFWGIYAMITASYSGALGSLIEAVNMVGSLFYGCLLGVFVLAFKFPSVRGGAAFYAVLIGEATIFALHLFGNVAFLWYNVIGCAVVMAAGLTLSRLSPVAK